MSQPSGRDQTPAVTVVVRAKDEERTIGRLLDILASQELAGEVQVIVVDSGSRDRTVAIACSRRVTVIEIPASDFTYGRALNVGAAAAEAPVIVALSAHAFPRDTGWLARLLAHFDDARVACVCGGLAGPDWRPLDSALRVDHSIASVNPFWGYSNGAGGFRTALWRRRAFWEEMPGSEDKDWAWHWLTAGYVFTVDPDLVVDHNHSRDPPIDCFRRARREWTGFGMFINVEPLGLLELASRWWRPEPQRAHWRSRCDPWRAALLVGEWAGRRRSGAAPGARPVELHL